MPPSVVIDPGHGGATAEGGSSANNAIGPNGVLEKDVTLDLARRLAALLSERANVVLTRTGDENRSLTDRSGIARASNAAVFVSLHFNGWKDPSVDGSEAWVATHAAPASRAFARAALDRVVAVTHARDRGVKEQDFGVLLPERLGANTAAALLELAFLTNPEEADAARPRRLQAGARAGDRHRRHGHARRHERRQRRRARGVARHAGPRGCHRDRRSVPRRDASAPSRSAAATWPTGRSRSSTTPRSSTRRR